MSSNLGDIDLKIVASPFSSFSNLKKQLSNKKRLVPLLAQAFTIFRTMLSNYSTC
jgi:hypothetical protein